MILPAHAALIRVEVARLLLANNREKQEIADMFGVTRQALYSTVERYDLDKPLKPFDKRAIAAAPYLQLALDPAMREQLVNARIIETLLGR